MRSMLQFHYEPDAIRASDNLANRLEHDLKQGKKVLWLVSGGSNIPLSVHIMEHLKTAASDKLAHLTIALSDERYGKPGHADSNWQQLLDAGFKPGAAETIHTLVSGLTLSDTCAAFEQRLGKAIAAADSVVAQLGIGGDGHIAGILPESAATNGQSQSENLVVGYDGGSYMRITITAMAFDLFTAVYCFAYGDNKRSALDRLAGQDLSESIQPAQLLKGLPEAYIYTDQHIG